jgi:hypothetical protein
MLKILRLLAPDREARDLDFKHNLEKQKIVARVEELVRKQM